MTIYIYIQLYNILILLVHSSYSFVNVFRVCKILNFGYSRSTSALRCQPPFNLLIKQSLLTTYLLTTYSCVYN